MATPFTAVSYTHLRPDCLEDDVVELLSRLNMVKPVWVELGLQTIHESHTFPAAPQTRPQNNP